MSLNRFACRSSLPAIIIAAVVLAVGLSLAGAVPAHAEGVDACHCRTAEGCAVVTKTCPTMGGVHPGGQARSCTSRPAPCPVRERPADDCALATAPLRLRI